MVKKIVCVLLILTLLFPLGGCWSYHSLNEITIIAGAGVDVDPSSGDYLLTCEVIDLSASTKEGGIKSKIVESRGETIFDAVRNAKKRLVNKMYWGNAQVLVIGNQLAKQGDIKKVIDWFISDAECRETIGIIVSQEKAAKDILTIEGLDNNVVAYEIKKIIDNDQSDTASLNSVQLFHAFNDLRSPGISLAIPAFHTVINNGKPAVEANGMAVFKGEKMLGYLTPDESKYFLFCINGVHGGVLTVSSGGQGKKDVSLEVLKSATKTSYSYTQGKVKMTIQTETEVSLDEMKSDTDLLDEKEISKIEKNTEDMLKNQILNVIKKVQNEYDSDIFEFGNLIYKKDPKLWAQLEPQWDDLFRTLQVEVTPKVNIMNTSFLKHR